MPDYSKNFLTSMTGYTPLVEEEESVSENTISFSDNQQSKASPKFDPSVVKENKKSQNQELIGEAENLVETGGDPIDPKKLPPAERAIYDKYTKMGYSVTMGKNGKLEFSKDGVVVNKKQDGIEPVKIENGRIPLPDYKNPDSRINYAKSFTEKYGPLMEKRGDTPLRINEKPAWGSDTSINLAKKSAAPFGIDPALFYVSSMEEGQSGLYPQKRKGREAEGELVITSGNKDYPISGLGSFGLDSFPDKYETLVKKGYLPKDFDKNFIVGQDLNMEDKGNGALFKTTDAAVQASAAMLKTYYDDVDAFVNKKGIQLSPKARDFFSLIGFNAGEGTARQMIEDYRNNGYLKDDAFLNERPTSGKGLTQKSYEKTYENVIRRLKMADAIKEEGLIDG